MKMNISSFPRRRESHECNFVREIPAFAGITDIFSLLLAVTILLFPFIANARFTNEGTSIRVAVLKGVPEAVLRGDLVVSAAGDIKGRMEKVITRQAVIRSNDQGFDVSGRKINAGTLKVSASGNIEIGGRKYVGEFFIHRDASGLLTLVDVLPIEEYLVGLVASEMPTDWPLEAVKAQAVSSRTYALYQLGVRQAGGSSAIYDVESTVMDQVYLGARGGDRARRAVEETKGEVLKYHGELFKSFFSSSCGGMTESAINVWGEKGRFPLIKDRYCERSPNNTWTYSVPRQELSARLNSAGFAVGRIESVQVERRDKNPRAATLVIGTGGQTLFLQGSDFRKAMGFDKIKSTWFDARLEGERVTFSGHGYGHGVGMCQWGAKGMADEGKTYREILKFYYPGARIGN